MVPAVAAEVSGMSAQLNTPALVSKVSAPNSRLSRMVCPVATSPPANVDVAVVEVAWKYSATTGPTTESFAYGDVVPMPMLPSPLTVRYEELFSLTSNTNASVGTLAGLILKNAVLLIGPPPTPESNKTIGFPPSPAKAGHE